MKLQQHLPFLKTSQKVALIAASTNNCHQLRNSIEHQMDQAVSSKKDSRRQNIINWKRIKMNQIILTATNAQRQTQVEVQAVAPARKALNKPLGKKHLSDTEIATHTLQKCTERKILCMLLIPTTGWIRTNTLIRIRHLL